MRHAVFYLLIILLTLPSCAPVRPNLGEPVSVNFADGLIREWYEQSSRIKSVQGLAKVKVQAPLNNIDGNQVVLAEMPDRLRAETLSPFGVPLLLLATDGNQFGVLLPSQNLYYLGTPSPENLGLFVNIPLEPSYLVGVLLYRPPMIDAWKIEAFTLKDGGWLVIRHGTLKRQELVFNAKRQLIEMSYLEENDLKFKVDYAEFMQSDEPFPARLTLELPEKYATITLSFSDFEINGRLKEGVFTMQPPSGAKVVYLPN